MKMGGTASKKFPDLSGDGKVTQKDILMGKGVTQEESWRHGQEGLCQRWRGDEEEGLLQGWCGFKEAY